MWLLALLPLAHGEPIADDLSADDLSAPPELWAGRYAIFGERKLPIIGQIRFRSDNYVLAEVVRSGDSIELRQRVCQVVFQKTAGASVSFDPTAPSAMPIAHIRFQPDAERGGLSAGVWSSGWDAKDHDHDGRPGISVHVRAPLCGGILDMASDARSVAHALPNAEGALSGEIDVYVDQQVLAIEGLCLSLVTKSHASWMRGRLHYVPVPAGTTCASLGDDGFPDPVAAAERANPIHYDASHHRDPMGAP